MDEERARIGDREDKEMEREGERERIREREMGRERIKEREKRPELERDDDSEHVRKRTRRDDDHRERSRSDADEIQVGGRSLVEMRPESETFLRLLELLGEWSEKGKVLIFVQSQEKCDALFKDLLKHGYPCLSLHGAKDQTDCESSTSDFKSNVLIATSIAARGLDVKDLELVINYHVPNHYEDYVHRVGRTITFLSEEDARYAPDLVKALELSEQAVPADLKALADGFKFNDEEDQVRKAAKKAQYGFEEDRSDSDSDDDGGDLSQQAALAQAAASKVAVSAPTSTPLVLNGGIPRSFLGTVLPPPPALPTDGAAIAAVKAAAINMQLNLAQILEDAMPEHYEPDLTF